jgi:single-stranded DNA-specific DHH superfamily exonuclease
MKLKNQSLIKKFKFFLSSVKKQDKVGIIYHADPDGIASAVIFSKLIKTLRGASPELFLYTPHLSQLPEKIQKAKKKFISKLFILDLSIDQLQDADLSSFTNVVILDHHKLYKDINSERILLLKPQMLYSDVNPDFYCNSKLSYDLANKIGNFGPFDWIAVIGIYGDGAQIYWRSFISRVLRRYTLQHELKNITEVIFYSISHKVANTKLCLQALNSADNFGNLDISIIRKYKRTIKKEIAYWNSNVKRLAEIHPSMDLVFDFIKPKYFINSSVIETISRKYPNKTVIIAQDMNQNIINISARRADGHIAVNELLENSIKNLPHASAGGHLRAAGGIIQKKDFFKFKQNIFKILSSQSSHN